MIAIFEEQDMIDDSKINSNLFFDENAYVKVCHENFNISQNRAARTPHQETPTAPLSTNHGKGGPATELNEYMLE